MLTAEDVRPLERLALAAPAMSHAGGTRQAGMRGNGLEFQDYRAYQPGDDVRSIDWRVEARLRHLVVRVTEAEGHLPLHVLVDVSGSMGIGTPSKLHCATRVAAALCYIAAARRDPLGITTFRDRLTTHLPSAPGRAQLFHGLDVLGAARAAGRSHLARCLDEYAAVAKDAGLLVVLSDFLGGADLGGLRYLDARGQLPVIIQVLADEDAEPALPGMIELVDAERPDGPTLMAHPEAVAMYRARLDAVEAGLRHFCRSHGRPFVQVRASATFTAILTACLDAGVLTLHG